MLRIGRQHLDEMLDHAKKEYPNECCGILAGKEGESRYVYRVPNIAPEPQKRYLMEPQQQLEAMLDSEKKGWGLLAFYHSHPVSEAYLSSTDIGMALETGWLDINYLLISLQAKDRLQLNVFRISGDGAVEVVPYTVL